MTSGLLQDSAWLMVSKLVMAATRIWRHLKAKNQLTQVIQDVTFGNDVEVTDMPA